MAGAPNTHVCRHPRRTARRENAIALAAERAKRSPAEQLAKLDAGGFAATKERARLSKQLKESP